MSDDFAVLANADGMVRVDLALGNIAELVLNRAGERVIPFQRAHWVDDPDGRG